MCYRQYQQKNLSPKKELQFDVKQATYPWHQLQAGKEYNSTQGELGDLAYRCLEGSNWLDDETIELSIKKIIETRPTEMQESYLFLDTFVLSCAKKDQHEVVAAFIENNEALNYDYLLSVSNTGAHWYLIVVNYSNKCVIALDSFHTPTSTIKSDLMACFKIILASYAVADFSTNINDWKFIRCKDTPIQRNSFDCGVHVIANAYCVINKLNLAQEIPSKVARYWIHTLIVNKVKNNFQRKTKKKLRQAKRKVEAVWCNINESELNVLEKCYTTFSKTKPYKYLNDWSTCSKFDCAGGKHAEKQIFCVACRKWFHEKCWPSKASFNETYCFCCRS